MNFRLLFNGIADVFFPKVCPVCSRHLADGERYVCSVCLAMMPRVQKDGMHCPEVEKMLLGCRLVERAVSMFEYSRSSPYSGILKDVKYHNSPTIAKSLAQSFAAELKGSGFFDGIDIIVPVPLHSQKLAKRGYNQSRFIVDGVSAVTGIPAADAIVAVKPHKTQTHRSTADRHKNVEGVFVAKPTVSGKRVLLVDDVITTGATVTACGDALRMGGASGICVLSLAFAGSI